MHWPTHCSDGGQEAEMAPEQETTITSDPSRAPARGSRTESRGVPLDDVRRALRDVDRLLRVLVQNVGRAERTDLRSPRGLVLGDLGWIRPLVVLVAEFEHSSRAQLAGEVGSIERPCCMIRELLDGSTFSTEFSRPYVAVRTQNRRIGSAHRAAFAACTALLATLAQRPRQFRDSGERGDDPFRPDAFSWL